MKQKPRLKRWRSPADFAAENTAFIDEVRRSVGVGGDLEGVSEVRNLTRKATLPKTKIVPENGPSRKEI